MKSLIRKLKSLVWKMKTALLDEEIKKLKVKNKELQNNELTDFNLVNNKSNLRYSHI